MPWYPVLGNHDYHMGRAAAMSQIERTEATDDDEWQMPGANYTMTFLDEAVRLIAIDTPKIAPYETHSTEDIYDDADVIAALEKFESDLNEAASDSKTKWILVMGHYPILSVAEHGDNQQLSELLLPLFKRYGVDAYFCGHDHSMQHITFEVTERSPPARARPYAPTRPRSQ